VLKFLQFDAILAYMLTQLLHLLVTVIVTFLLYPLWIKFVYKFNMGEEIRGDVLKSHSVKKGTPTMGGLVFVLTVSLMTFLFNRSRTQTLFPVFIASLAGLFGLVEDFSKVYKKSLFPKVFSSRFSFTSRFISKRKFKLTPWGLFVEFWRIVGSKHDSGLHTYQKFLFQAFIGGFVAFWTYFKLGWDYIWFPLIGDVGLGILYPFIIFFLFIAVLNAVAFTDGLDGLAGGLSAIAFGAYWVIAVFLSYYSLAVFCATFIGALIPFLYFNVYPARVFMGNVGSHVLGATLAVMAVVLHRETALVFILAVFLVDGITSPLQQFSVKLTGKRLLRIAPLHHHFEFMDWPEVKVTLRFWLFGIFFAFLGVFIAFL